MSGPNGKPRLGVHPLIARMMERIQDEQKTEETGLRIDYGTKGVRITFDKPILWLGLDPDGAEELAGHLLELAKLSREAAEAEAKEADKVIVVPGDPS